MLNVKNGAVLRWPTPLHHLTERTPFQPHGKTYYGHDLFLEETVAAYPPVIDDKGARYRTGRRATVHVSIREHAEDRDEPDGPLNPVDPIRSVDNAGY